MRKSRKAKAAELFRLVNDGPAFSDTKAPAEVYRLWSTTWILPLLRDLVAELRAVPFDYATSEPASSAAVRKVFHNLGYRLVEDDWREGGRRTYQHHDNASAAYMRSLSEVFDALHWHCAPHGRRRLFRFTHITTGELIEIEPGGAGIAGHYLHHMTAKAAAK